MNPRIEKITSEIERIRDKVAKQQARLRELEKQLTELENADIVAAVRGVDIAPDELAAFVRMFREKQDGHTVPDLDRSLADSSTAMGMDTARAETETDNKTNNINEKGDTTHED